MKKLSAVLMVSALLLSLWPISAMSADLPSAISVEDVAIIEAAPAESAFSVMPVATAATEPVAATAELQETSAGKAKITVESVEVKSKLEAGSKKEVDVKLSISDNPGITGAVLTVNFAQGMTLKAITRGDALASLNFTPPGQFAADDPYDPFTPSGAVISPVKLLWDGVTREADTSNGVLATLTFEVPTDVAANYAVSVTAVAGDIYEASNENAAIFDDVEVDFVAGGINIIEQTYIPGDINGDGKVNLQDKATLARYLAGWDGYEAKVNLDAADTNGDGKLNMQDKTILARHIAGWTGYETLPKK